MLEVRCNCKLCMYVANTYSLLSKLWHSAELGLLHSVIDHIRARENKGAISEVFLQCRKLDRCKKTIRLFSSSAFFHPTTNYIVQTNGSIFVMETQILAIKKYKASCCMHKKLHIVSVFTIHSIPMLH